ncbi:N-acyl homoserine lactonase family protein [Novosphingobium sp. SG720]|uniref:N-acyl homoserine lactonase family protein n=1 Tax=Novosphingobium sp. SG720 TaxID=2586998 RepID=UPI001446853E|nr:N-acyl homoserine lactonase family protein [Novosphingobium sp. SG720]NKJ40626.1 glyoxylase-like metal-dependent hydrolase (beta-lactamase superfamily II) [Novosphingobium sp. SG720]
MTNWTVTTLRIGELYLQHGGAIVRDPVHVWLVRGEVAGKAVNLLVDSGMADIPTVHQRLRVKGWGGGHAALTAALEQEGLGPQDIDYVVCTHLHFDHADNLDLFPQACVVVQRAELMAAVDPVPSQRIFYWKSTLRNLIERKRPTQLRLIEGDTDLLPGIRLLFVPSHTEGMQVVVVTTEKGRVALVSDLGDHYRYWYPADPRATDQPLRSLSDAFLTGNIRSESERAWQAAMRRVLDNADIVVPAHDFRIPLRMPEQWFAIPDSTEGDLAHVPPADAQN